MKIILVSLTLLCMLNLYASTTCDNTYDKVAALKTAATDDSNTIEYAGTSAGAEDILFSYNDSTADCFACLSHSFVITDFYDVTTNASVPDSTFDITGTGTNNAGTIEFDLSGASAGKIYEGCTAGCSVSIDITNSCFAEMHLATWTATLTTSVSSENTASFSSFTLSSSAESGSIALETTDDSLEYDADILSLICPASDSVESDCGSSTDVSLGETLYMRFTSQDFELAGSNTDGDYDHNITDMEVKDGTFVVTINDSASNTYTLTVPDDQYTDTYSSNELLVSWATIITSSNLSGATTTISSLSIGLTLLINPAARRRRLQQEDTSLEDQTTIEDVQEYFKNVNFNIEFSTPQTPLDPDYAIKSNSTVIIIAIIVGFLILSGAIVAGLYFGLRSRPTKVDSNEVVATSESKIEAKEKEGEVDPKKIEVQV